MPRNTVLPAASSLTLLSDTEIQLVRDFAAPREQVWRAFTDPKLLPQWYGPGDPPMTVCEMDVRPNGKFRWAWGTAFETGGIFHQVEKPRLLVMESREPDPTPEVRSHTFDEKDGRTTLTIRIKTASKAIRDELLASGAIEGMEPTFARLDAFLAGRMGDRPGSKAQRTVTPSTLSLPSDREIKIEREFNAPRDRVWRCWTDPKLLPKWMGYAAYRMTVSEMDVRTGGTYRWSWDMPPAGLTIHGKFVEVDAPRRIVTDESMEPSDLREPSRNVTTFTETDGRTTVSILLRLPTKAARDAALATGMKEGLDVSYGQLDAVLRAME